MVDVNDPMPERLSERTLNAKGIGDVFAGREAVIEDLLENALLQKELRDGAVEQGERTAGVANVVTAPPGAGKTALLDAMAQNLHDNGLGCIKLNATEMLQEEELARKMHKSNLRQIAERAREIWTSQRQELASWEPEPTDSYIEKAKQGVKRSLRAVARRMERIDVNFDIDAGINLWDHWRQQPANFDLNLQAHNLLFPQGWVMFIDEVQQWEGLDSTSKPAVTINAMAESSHRGAAGLGHGNVIMAGLNDSITVLRAMNITRVQQKRLGPIKEPEAAEVIDFHIRKGVGENGGTAVPDHDRWVAELSKEYHVWAHHMRAAAWSAEWVAQHHPTHPAGLRWIHERTQTAINVLYEDRIASATENIPRRVLAVILARQRRANQALTRDEALDMLATARKFDETELMDDFRPKQLLTQILHSGVLELDGCGHLVVPIPSLSTYCENELVVEPDLWQRLIGPDSHV